MEGKGSDILCAEGMEKRRREPAVRQGRDRSHLCAYGCGKPDLPGFLLFSAFFVPFSKKGTVRDFPIDRSKQGYEVKKEGGIYLIDDERVRTSGVLLRGKEKEVWGVKR